MDYVEINTAICKLLGIDPSKAFEIDIKIRTDSYPVIHTKSYSTELNEDGLLIVQHAVFELVKKKGDGDATL
jgi:hypothetical protein